MFILAQEPLFYFGSNSVIWRARPDLNRRSSLMTPHQNFAQPTGFEPAISAVTGQRFKPAKLRLHDFWCGAGKGDVLNRATPRAQTFLI